MDTIVAVAIAGSVLAGVIAIGPTIKVGLDMAPYLYANTRCSSRSGLILRKKEYEQLLGASSIQEVYALLEDTYYGKLMEHAGDELSNLFYEDLYETYVWLESITPTKLKNIIKAIRMKFEIADLKSAINSCAKGEAPVQLNHIEEESFRIKLESCKDLDAFIAALKDTKYEEALGQNSSATVAVLSNQLDSLYYNDVAEEIRLLKDNEGAVVFRDYWKKSIDLVNIRLTLRRIKGVMDLTLIEGGFLDVKDLQSATDKMQLESILSKSVYKDFMTGVSGVEIETALFSSFRKEASNVNAKHALKTGTLVKFLISKELEIRNLNILTKLKREDYTTDEIEKLLVL